MSENAESNDEDGSGEKWASFEGSKNSTDECEDNEESASDDDSGEDELMETLLQSQSISDANGKSVRAANVSTDDDSSSDEFECLSDETSSDEEEYHPSPNKKSIPLGASRETRNQVNSKKPGKSAVIAQSETEIEIDDRTEITENDEESETGSVEQISLLTVNNETTAINDDSNKENDESSAINVSNSTQSITENSSSVVSVNGQSFHKPVTKLPTKKKTTNKSTNKSTNSSHDERIENQTFGPMKGLSLVSSTPYRNSNVSGHSSVNIVITSPATSTRSRSKAAVTME